MTAASNPHSNAYAELRSLSRQAATMGAIGSLLSWDQETYMPASGADSRAEQLAMVSALAHEQATSPRIGELLTVCEADKSLTADPDSRDASNLREMRRLYDRRTKLPTDLVAELAKAGSNGQQVWKEARAKSDFAMFRPSLEHMMALTRRKAECYGIPKGGELYDALLEEYEPGATARQIEGVFKPLGERLSGLVEDLSKGKKPDDSPLNVKFPAAKQHELGQFVLNAMGFEFKAGRLDVTTHPFCSGVAPGDTRLTTRYRDEKFTDALYGTMHEGGHGLYEQGLPKGERFGEPLGDSISLGIHESQSRMWENFVGRGPEFWNWLLPTARKLAGGALDAFTPDALYRAVNTGTPSLIRVEADEATYNLHVMLRFEIERGLFSGSLAVKDVPAEWNKLVKRFLGIDVPDDRRGCMQDVHWSAGLIGYFPTYTLGNLYAAQFWETINQQIPDLKAQMARGEFLPLRNWLNTNIHGHGMRYRASELCQRLTGKPLSADPLMRHLEGKLRPIYGV